MQLATISNQIKCYDWPLGKCCVTYSPRVESPLPIKSASWASNSGWMCIVTSIGDIEILSFAQENAKLLCQIKDITGVTYATFQNVTKRNLAIARNDQILIYDMKNERVKKEYGPTMNHSAFLKLKFDSCDAYLCGSTKDNKVYVYNQVGTHHTFQACNIGSLKNFAINYKSNLKIAACTNIGTCVVWELDGATNICSEPSKCPIHDIVFDQSNCLLYITEDQRCVFRDFYNTTTISEINLPYKPICMDFCNDGIGFAICSDDGTVYAYDVRRMGVSLNKLPKEEDCGKIVQIAFDRDYNSDIIPCYDSLSRVSEVNYKQIVQDFEIKESMSNFSQNPPVESVPCEIIYYDKQQSRTCLDIVTVRSEIKSEDVSCKKIPDIQMSAKMCDEIRSIVQETIREEVLKVKSDLKRFVQDTVYDSTKKNFLDLQMAMVKEFIKIEDCLNHIEMNTNINKSLRSLGK